MMFEFEAMQNFPAFKDMEWVDAKVLVCSIGSACRYAGRAFETVGAAEAGTGTLLVKGLKSMWRQAAPILRTTLQGVLQCILMQAGHGKHPL